MRNFRELRVWERSHNLAVAVYRETKGFPRDEKFGLTSQIRRAVSSIGANIAEGCGRRTDPEMLRFLRIAMGSATEVECHLLLAIDLGYLQKEHFKALEHDLNEVKGMIGSLMSRIESDLKQAAEQPRSRVARA